MKKAKTRKTIGMVKTDNSWFDSKNASLIILCATLGVFGAHKFAQRKYFQGILYILFDLTIFGIIVTFILSWFDLVFLTAKPDNRPGNMLLGVIFIMLESFILIPGSTDIVIKNMKSLDDGDSVVVVKTSVQPDKVTKEIMDAAKNADVRVSEKIGEITLDNGERPVFVVDTGEVVTDISVEKDGVVFVAKPLEPSEINKSGDEPAVDNAKVLHDEKPAANVVEPKHEMEHGHRNVQPKKQNLAQKNAEQHMDAQKETVDDFENFSIYNMIAG